MSFIAIVRPNVATSSGTNVTAPADLNAAARAWPVTHADAIVCINMIHIAPWQATLDLMQGAGRVLGRGAPLFLYGPFRRAGAHTAPSNEAFDADLKRRNADWGVRDLEAVAEIAKANGLDFVEAVPMPANNFSVIFRKV
jgi:hypothetical protein